MKKLGVLFIGILIFASCADNNDPLGVWDDNIKLSIKNVEITAKTDSTTITTGGDWWWVDSILFEDSTYIYYNREDIDLESDSYSIKEESFLVERRDKNTLFIKIDENSTGIERKMNVILLAGNYSDNVIVIQPAN